MSISALVASAALCKADTVVGIFSDPQATGNLITVDGSLQYYDNSSTAVSSIVNNTDIAPGGGSQQLTGSKLDWGAGASNPNYSSLTFFGKTLPADPYQVFDLGTISYSNGTSDLNSIIFGATLTLYATPDGSVGPQLANSSSFINIVTTANIGTADTAYHDADFVTLSGIANKSFNVLEGQAATAELYGKFINDPTIQLTDIVLNPGQSGSAFIGNGSPVPVSETSNLLAGIVVLGFAGFEWFQRKLNRQIA